MNPEICTYERELTRLSICKPRNCHPAVRHREHVIFSGKTGCGKTLVLLNMLLRYMCVDTITIITRDTEEDKYKLLEEKFRVFIDAKNEVFGTDVKFDDVFKIYGDINDTPDLLDFDKGLQNMVVFDDMATEKNMKKVRVLFSAARKMNCTCFFLTQNYYSVDKFIRNNAVSLILFRNDSKRDLQLIAADFAGELKFDDFLNIYNEAVKEIHQFLYMNKNSSNKYRKGFNCVLKTRFQKKNE